MSCVFCAIAAGEAKAKLVYKDEQILAFHAHKQRAKVHILVIPKQHISSLFALTDSEAALIGHLTVKIAQIAALVGLQSGFKVAINTGSSGGQKIPHIHYHVLSGLTIQ